MYFAKCSLIICKVLWSYNLIIFLYQRIFFPFPGQEQDYSIISEEKFVISSFCKSCWKSFLLTPRPNHSKAWQSSSFGFGSLENHKCTVAVYGSICLRWRIYYYTETTNLKLNTKFSSCCQPLTLRMFSCWSDHCD